MINVLCSKEHHICVGGLPQFCKDIILAILPLRANRDVDFFFWVIWGLKGQKEIERW